MKLIWVQRIVLSNVYLIIRFPIFKLYNRYTSQIEHLGHITQTMLITVPGIDDELYSLKEIDETNESEQMTQTLT